MIRIFKSIFHILLWFLGTILSIVLLIGVFSWYHYDRGYSSVTASERDMVFSGAGDSLIITSDSGSYRRTGNTFMSMPEWYIVSISHDYTQWLEGRNNPSDFPYIQYLKDYWYMYGRITSIMDGYIPRDTEYHTMVQVIGISTTLEFGLKAFYENTLGRLTSLMSYDTETDTYYTQISRKYVDFILLRPWYEFDYTTALDNLHLTSSSMRGVERFGIVWFELFLKKQYAKIIESATHKAFALPDIWTTVNGKFSPEARTIDLQNIEFTQSGIKITRYYPFTSIFPKLLLSSGATVMDIAGNRSIVIELLNDTGKETYGGIQPFVSLPVPIDPTKERRYYYLEVEDIKRILSLYSQEILHIYDF